MACCIFASWLIRTLVIGPLRALLGRDPGRGDAYATAPKGVRWRPVEEPVTVADPAVADLAAVSPRG